MLQLFTVFFYTVNVLGCFHAINCGTLFIYVKNYVEKGRIKKKQLLLSIKCGITYTYYMFLF